MSWRALLIGFLGAMLISAFGYINNNVLRLERIEAGHLLPVGVLVMMLPVVLLSGILGAIHRAWRFRAGELAIMVLMMLTACSISGRGFMEQFTPVLDMPAHWNNTRPGWQERNLLQRVPDQLLPANGEYRADVTGGFVQGLGRRNETVAFGDVPWSAWARPLGTWLPLVLLTGTCMVCLAVVVHRQWSAHEKLRYPIAEVTATLLQPDRLKPPLYRSRGFWVALVVVMGLHGINGIHAWFPESIEVPLFVNFSAIGQIWPSVWKVDFAGAWMSPRIYFTAIGIAFFIASDVSLSVGLTHTIYVIIASVLVARGVSLSTDYYSGGPMAWQRFGSAVAFACIIFYVGRRYYFEVMGRAFGRRGSETASTAAVWAMRVGLVSATALVVGLTLAGMTWSLAILFVLLMLLSFLIVSRVTAETGLFFIQLRWIPIGILLGLLGGRAIGPEGLLVVGLASAVLCLDPSQALMPYLINGLRLCELTGIKTGRAASASWVVYVVGIGLAVTVGLWANYNWGSTGDYWSLERIPKNIFDTANREVSAVSLAGELPVSEQLAPLQRVLEARPKPGFLAAAGIGFVVLLVVASLRLRFTWWPLHPVVFLLMATYPAMILGPSFLVGWAIKTVILRLGGQRVYDSAKPVMIGMIAGELLGAAIFVIIGGIYYTATGLPPETYGVFPR